MSEAEPKPSVVTVQGGNLVTGHEVRASLHQNDCLKYLSSLEEASVDVLVTDPAYSGMNNHLKLGRGRIVGDYAKRELKEGKWFGEFEDSLENFGLFLSGAKRVLNPERGHLYIMFDSYSLLSLAPLVRDYFDVKNLITWDKVNLGMGHYYRRRHEFVLFATSGNTRKLSSRRFPDVWRFKRLSRAPWPTQKPVELFQAMLFASAEPGYVVCDPFMGSGSSAVAAFKNGCHFTGCDVSDEAIGLTLQRLESFVASGQDTLQPQSAVPEGETVFWE